MCSILTLEYWEFTLQLRIFNRCFVSGNFTLMLSHYHRQTRVEDMLGVGEETLLEKTLRFLQVKVNALLRPLNQADLHWLWQVEQGQTIRLAAALLLMACHPIFFPLWQMV